VTESQLAIVLGRLPSGLFILTARRGGEETGMLVSWVMQAGFEPPMLTVAIRKDRLLAAWLTDGTPFVLNLLSEKQKPLLAHFSHGFDEKEPAFSEIGVGRTAAGVPVLSGTIGYLECEPTEHIDSGDHRVFLATVISGHVAEGQRPMVHIRKNGFKY
jgi:flavin reductase (DIM6/NTAB) family NADH-FMN oxidoreductase RutF